MVSWSQPFANGWIWVLTQLFAKGWVQNEKMYYVYLLLNTENQKYIGYTQNLRRRIIEHLHKKTYTTKRMGKLSLFYYEAYADQEAAIERERKLKQFGSSYHGLIKRLKLKT